MTNESTSGNDPDRGDGDNPITIRTPTGFTARHKSPAYYADDDPPF